MTITFFSNFLNHHQKLVADELYKLIDKQYTFVETVPMYDWLKKGGYTDYSHEPYVLRAWETNENMTKAIELAKTSDVAFFGGVEVLFLEVIRAQSTNKLTFEVGERWLKKGLLNMMSPRFLRNMWYYYTLFRKKPFYKLCSSAYGAADQYRLHSFIDRCFKWGYFTKVENFDLEASLAASKRGGVTILWCARFLSWKHPELPIYLAKRLKDDGYVFKIDMIGSGEMFERTEALAKTLAVDDVVSFMGNMPNEEVLQQMRCHRIFLFTSDRNEGWGAVANESMSNGCVLVASDAIGSAPFLIKNGENGLLFKSSKPNRGFLKSRVKVDLYALDSLTDKIKWLLSHPDECRVLASNAVESMNKIWSPQNATKNLINLINDLQLGKEPSILDGPCSRAYPILNKY